MTVAEMTQFFGWMSVINIGLLLVSTIAIVSMRGFITRIHAQLFSMDEQDLGRAYFQYLAQYKIVIIVFNIAPYLALRFLL